MNVSARLRRIAVASLAAGGLIALPGAQAQTLGAPFAAAYTVNSLGSVAGLPSNYGGLTFLDNNTLLIGGSANNAAGRLYTVPVVRNAGGHVTGFGAGAVQFGTGIGDFNDGGVTVGPGGVLFTSRWPVNALGQTKPGSLDEDKIIDLAAAGVASSHAALNFVPSGFAGAGKVKLVSWAGGQWYSGTLQPDGTGTYDITGIAQVDLNPAVGGTQNVPGGPEGFVFIDGANAGFGVDSMLISEYSAGAVGAYELDADGNPLVNTRRTFLSGLTGAEGAVIDPVTGDFLFSTFGGGSRVVVVSGFTAPVPTPLPNPIPIPIPEPSTWALMAAGLAFCAWGCRRRA